MHDDLNRFLYCTYHTVGGPHSIEQVDRFLAGGIKLFSHLEVDYTVEAESSNFSQQALKLHKIMNSALIDPICMYSTGRLQVWQLICFGI